MPKTTIFLILLTLALFFGWSCMGEGDASDTATSVEVLNEKVGERVQKTLRYALRHDGLLEDSIQLSYSKAISNFYDENGFVPIWSDAGQSKQHADSMLVFVRDALHYGLFPQHYHADNLQKIQLAFEADTAGTSARRDITLWTRYELLLTDAFIGIARDLDVGRLAIDSTFLRADSIFKPKTYLDQLKHLLNSASLSSIMHGFEPVHSDYHALKKGLRRFLDTANIQAKDTYIDYPYRDSMVFISQLTQRLKELGALSWNEEQVDTLVLKNAILKVQEQRGLTRDGKYGQQLIGSLNLNSREKMIRLAINLDRYKKMPKQMPERYIWVNIPGFYLQVRENDSLMLHSKIVVGKPKTRTPLLQSAIGNIVTYPQWTIPNSIIIKEILPALKRNPGYLSKKGYSLLTWKGEEVDPYTVNWSKYTKGIPYKIVQGSGDDNALGVLKFNFANPFDVYMHDTNQRFYFDRSERALSHGCVRVQAWDSLSRYVTALDTGLAERKQPPAILDSLHKWLENKQKRTISLRYRLPLYFRYVTAEMKNDKIVFYGDLYGEDAIARRQLMKVP